MNVEATAASPVPSELKRRSIVVMILLALVTLGVYNAVWFFRTRRGFNKLGPYSEVPLAGCVALLILTLANDAIDFLRGFSGDRETLEVPKLLVLLGVAIVLLTLSFRIKGILETYLSRPANNDDPPLGISRIRSELSGVLTFFLSIFYLQYIVNKRVLPQPAG